MPIVAYKNFFNIIEQEYVIEYRVDFSIDELYYYAKRTWFNYFLEKYLFEHSIEIFNKKFISEEQFIMIEKKENELNHLFKTDFGKRTDEKLLILKSKADNFARNLVEKFEKKEINLEDLKKQVVKINKNNGDFVT